MESAQKKKIGEKNPTAQTIPHITSNHNLWTAIKAGLLEIFVDFSHRFFGSAGAKSEKLHSRPHNYRFDLWQHFRSQLLRVRRKNWPKSAAEGECVKGTGNGHRPGDGKSETGAIF